MLDRLLESGAREGNSSWGGAASVVVHGALIVLAVVSTATGQPLPKFTGDDTHIIPINPPPAPTTTAHAARGGRSAGGARTDAPTIPTIDVPATIESSIPTPPTAPDGAGDDASLLSEIGGGASGAGMALGGAAVASDAVVDVPVRALVDRAPAYPETLRAAGIGGTVRVRFVVDTTGRAELSSVRVIESAHELFTRAVLASLRQARFTPGEISGRRVRTLVERSFRFDIAAGAR